jgi:hypothetical protein
MRVSCISFFGGLLLRFECAADGRQAQGLAVEHAKKAWAVSGTYRALNTAIEPAGYRGPFEFDALFTKAGQPARPAPVVFGEKNSMHSRFTDIEFSTNLQHQREKRCAGFHLHGKDLG